MSGITGVGLQKAVDHAFQEEADVNELTHRVELLAIETLDGRLAYIVAIGDTIKSKQAFVALTESHLETGDLMKVVEAFDKVHRASDECNSFTYTAAIALLQAGDLSSARVAAMKLVSRERRGKVSDVEKQRNPLLIAIAEAYYAHGNYDLAYDCIAPIRVGNKGKNNLLTKLGDAYVDSENYDEALKFYRQIDDRTFAVQREDRLSTLATCCITAGQWHYAKLAIKEIIHDEKTKASLLSLLVDCCSAVGNLDTAFMVLSHFIIFETDELRQMIEALHCQIFVAYMRSGEFLKAIKCLQKLVQLIVQNEFSINGVDHAFKKSIEQYERIATFSTHIMRTHFEEIKKIFGDGDSEYVICQLRDLVSKHATIEAFKEHFKVEEDCSRSTKFVSEEEKNNAFKEFELPTDASQEDIKRRYRQFRLIYHPDKVLKSKNESESKYQQRVLEVMDKLFKVTLAFDILTNI